MPNFQEHLFWRTTANGCFCKSVVHIVRLTIWHKLFLELWLVGTWSFPHPRDQRAVTHLENVRQWNKKSGKKLGFQLSHRRPQFIKRTETWTRTRTGEEVSWPLEKADPIPQFTVWGKDSFLTNLRVLISNMTIVS